MGLTFFKPEVILLKGHPEFSEKWIQQRIIDDPSILGIDDVELVAAEKIQPKAGRLDLLLQDEQLNRRYEVELMLGATNPSHIMRCIEYWDIERRRYPAYEHVAVLVAEDITSRFLNLISLLAGSIPLIAIQMKALRVDDKIVLHFAHVLDQTELRTDDEHEFRDGDGSVSSKKDRQWWQQQTPENILKMADEVLEMVTTASEMSHKMEYLKKAINIVTESGGDRQVWLRPRKTVLNIGAYQADPEQWVKRFEDVGLAAGLRRGNKAAVVTIAPEAFNARKPLLAEFFASVFSDAEEGDK